MEKYLKGLLFPDSLLTLKLLRGRRATCTATVHLFCSLTCLSVLFSSADAAQLNSETEQGKIHFGFGLQTRNNIGFLMVANGPQSVRSCYDICFSNPECSVLWLLKDTCILADCRTPHHCHPTKMDSRDSLLVFLDKEHTSWTLPFHHISDIVNQEKYQHQKTHRPRLKRGSLLRFKGRESDPNREKKQQVPVNTALEHSPPSSREHQMLVKNTAGNQETELYLPSLAPSTLPLSESPLKMRPSASINTNSLPSEDLPGTDEENPDTVTSLPFLIPGNKRAHPTPVPTSTGKIKLVVSAGGNAEITLPKNEVQLNAIVVPEPPEGKVYVYDWRLITHPKDYSGEMEGKHTPLLKLSKLSAGLYEFKVIVNGEDAHGEGFVNVMVKPEPQLNQPPVAVVSPRYQEISLPTTSTVLDGSQSTDDEKIVSYLWEELKGPIREEKITGNEEILKFTNLVPGNYTFRGGVKIENSNSSIATVTGLQHGKYEFTLTVKDEQGLQDKATVSIIVKEEINKPPVAKIAGNVVITLPTNSAELDGSKSSDDKGIVSYQWTRDENSPRAGEVLNNSNHNAVLFLSNLVEGTYTFQLKVTDAKGEFDTDRATVEVKPDAAQPNSETEQGRIVFGFGLRTRNNIGFLMVANGPQSVQSCYDICFQNPACSVLWLLKDTCILADCRTPHHCQPTKMDSRDSMLVLLDKKYTSWTSPFHHISGIVNQKEYRHKKTLRPKLKRGALLRVKRQDDDEDYDIEQKVPVNTALEQDPPSKRDHKMLANNTVGDQETELYLPSLAPSTLPLSESPLTMRPSASINSINSLPSEDLPDTDEEYPDTVTPFLIPGNTSVHPTTAPTSTSSTTPDIIKLVVSAGGSAEITLPKNEVQLNAFVVPEPPEGKVYTYDWRLITHPKDYSGEMEGKHTQSLKLSKLTAGLYEFKVIADGENAHGEGSVNVTVKPEPRVNQPPVAVVSPRYQEISLPTTSTVIDGSQSTDDEKIVSYLWEELKGPLREEKITGDKEILKLTNLVPGNYTFRLTVEDSDGAKNSTTANLTVNKAVDYPPVANAGANQIVQLPKNSVVLYGNLSTDDHGIVSYEWSLSPNSKGKVMEMQGVRTSTLQLSALQEGDYTFQLTVTDSAGQQSTSEVTVIVQPENNKPPHADAGPDKELTLPVDSTTLDGSHSSDDQWIASYLWEKAKGPEGVKIENSNSSIATVTGLQDGKYEFTLTVKDNRGLQDKATVSVIVKEEINKPPVAKIAGNVVITLPTNTAELDGSKSSDDKGIVSYQWEREENSPAAGEVLNNSNHHAVLFLSNLVEGTYTFHLKVTDAKGEFDTDRATVEVKPDPVKNNLVEMILDVSVSQLTERQKGMFMRQIGVLLGVLDSDITVQKIQLYTEKSTKVVFYVKNQPPHLVMKGYQVACTLRNELRKQQSDFLIFKALEIDTFTCQLNCSMHGHCNSVTKRCVCDPFWMENFIRRKFGDGESNCDWSVLYVIITSFLCVVALGLLMWCMVCCCKRKKGKPKRKSRYKILEATDDQESVELKPSIKPGIKMKSPIQNTSLMHSESEMDSDDNAYTWSDREKGKLLRPQNGSLRNGQASHKIKNQREELL